MSARRLSVYNGYIPRRHQWVGRSTCHTHTHTHTQYTQYVSNRHLEKQPSAHISSGHQTVPPWPIERAAIPPHACPDNR